MTNYVKYPYHRFYVNTFIIGFGSTEYSWCYATESQKKYLSTSKYLDRALWIEYKDNDGNIHKMTPDEFKLWASK